MTQTEGLTRLRLAINENLRVQRGGADPVPYIDVSNVLNDIGSRQNHAVFARRGCGKTLLLHHSSRQLDSSIKAVYLNCEDFKRHTFPNVLIEILDALFGELERHLTGWFGKKKRSRNLIGDIRKELDQLRSKTDTQEQDVRESLSRDNSASANVGASVSSAPASLRAGAGMTERIKAEIERTYRTLDDKIREAEYEASKAESTDPVSSLNFDSGEGCVPADRRFLPSEPSRSAPGYGLHPSPVPGSPPLLQGGDAQARNHLVRRS